MSDRSRRKRKNTNNNVRYAFASFLIVLTHFRSCYPACQLVKACKCSLLCLSLSLPSNIHYVGYVEDEESVEAIVKKFEELERIEHEFAASRSAAGSSRDAGSSSAMPS